MPNFLFNAIQTFGWIDGSLYLLNRVFSKLRDNRNITLRRLAKEDQFTETFGRQAGVLNSRLASGAVCIAAYKDNKIIGFLWVTLTEYREDEVQCNFEPQPKGEAAWDFDIYLKPQYRMGRLFLRLWDNANIYLRENNVYWTMSRISAMAPGSLSSHQRLGAKCVGSAVFIKLLKYQLMISTLSPYIHLSTNNEAVPVVRVYPPSNH